MGDAYYSCYGNRIVRDELDDNHICPMCNRQHTSQHMSWHHLLPKDGDQEKDEPRIYVCLTCHSVVHFCHTNSELRQSYNTLDKLLRSAAIMKMINMYKNDHKTNKIYKIKKLKQQLRKKCA